MKDNYVVGKKRPEMLAKVPNAKVVLFISNQSLAAIFQPSHLLILQLLHPSMFIPTSMAIREMRVHKFESKGNCVHNLFFRIRHAG